MKKTQHSGGSDFSRQANFCGEMLPPTGPHAEVQLGEDGLVNQKNYRLTQLTQHLKNHNDLQNVQIIVAESLQ